MTDGLTGIINR